MLAHIFVSSDEPERQCKQALAYGRVLSSHGTSSAAPYYEETSTLRPQYLRTVCRKKVDGVIVDPPLSDETQKAVGTELEISLKLVAGSRMRAEIHGTEECESGPLQLELALE